MRMWTVPRTALIAIALGCSSASEPGGSRLSLTFRYDGVNGGPSASIRGAMAVRAAAAQGPLVILGADGASLEIADIRLIVDEFKLEGEQNACEELDDVPTDLETRRRQRA